MRTHVVLCPKTELTFSRGDIHLKLPDVPGVVFRFTMIDTIVRRVANPKLLILRLPEGYVLSPDFPGKDRDVEVYLLRDYSSFGAHSKRETIFFIPKPYVLYIDRTD